MYFSKLLLADIVEFGISNGADKEDLCRSLDINWKDKINPKEQVSYEKMIKVLNITGQTINDEYLGLHLGEQMMLKGTAQVDDIMRSSATIEEAFSNAVTYGKLISDALNSKMEKSDTSTKISFDVNPNWMVLESHAVQQIIDMTLVCTLKSIYWLTGKKYLPIEVHLNNPLIKKRSEYYRVFDCRVKFNKQVPCIIFQNSILDQVVLSHNLGLLDYLKKEANDEIEKLQTEHPMIMSIKKCVLENLPEKCEISFIASELNLSSRTLQRKLQGLDTNYKEVEKDVLIKLAKKLILHEERSMDEISYLLGFSEASAFIRFFKNEIKISPKKYKILKNKNLT